MNLSKPVQSKKVETVPREEAEKLYDALTTIRRSIEKELPVAHKLSCNWKDIQEVQNKYRLAVGSR